MKLFPLLTGILVLAVSYPANAGLHYGAVLAPASEVSQEDSSAYSELSVLTRAFLFIRQNYVDEKKTSYHDLTYNALRGMLKSLDPHSQFMDPDDYQDMQDDTKSEFGGLGVSVVQQENKIVLYPQEDAPAFRAGILPGDEVLKIDGKSTENMDLKDVVALTRGESGQKVTLTIWRPASQEIKEISIIREIIKIASVKEAKLVDKEMAGDFKIGYLRITQFSEPTAEELEKKLTELDQKGVQALIIDLRHNPGGLLDSAVEVCGKFLPPNEVVVYTEGRNPSSGKIFRTPSGKREWRKYPLAIMINYGSASGSEIVAGALKDLDRAIIVGETSFGKGSVQSVMPLPDGSALRLTTAKYYTPSKQVIHERGVAPNIRASMGLQEEAMLWVQRREEALGKKEKTSSVKIKDVPLERAVDALKGALLYANREGVPLQVAKKDKAPQNINH